MMSDPVHNVLIVEDDPDIRDSLIDFLEDHGYQAVGAADGREALQKLGTLESQPCMIILDLMMPRMDGRTFRLEQLRDPALSGIPVVVISAYQDVALTVQELNVAGCLSKPVNLKALLQVVQAHCPMA